MIYLRQSTASQEITLGPFLDSTDGNTEETGLTIANTDILIRKSGATTLSAKNSGGATHISGGIYYAVLDATDTDTIGSGEIYCHVAGALACKESFCVLDEAVFDVLFGTTAPSTLAAGALMGLADDAITASKIAANAITSSEAPALANLDAAISTRLASASYVSPLDAAGVRSAVGLASANLDTQIAGLPTDADVNAACDTAISDAALATAAALATVDGIVDAILVDTGTDIPAAIAALPTDADVNAACDTAIFDAALATAANLATVDGVVDGIATQVGVAGAGLTAVPWNAAWDAEAQSECADALAAYDPPTSAELTSAVSPLATSAEITALNDLDAAGIRTAIGLASANLDTQISALPTAAENADAVWDELLTGATHNIATSAGRRILEMASIVVLSGTAVSSTTNTIVLDADASSVDGAYDPAAITISEGTGAGQSRLILQYVGSTKTAIIDRDWKVNPDGTSRYIISASIGREHVNEGLAQAATSGTITLNANASSLNDAYNGQVIFIRSGTGEDQARRVASYNGTTKVATLERIWGTNPDATSAYVMLPSSILPPGMASDDMLAAVIEGTLTFGEWIKLVSSALFGKTSGAPSGPIAFRDIGDTKDRITATVDDDGNRSGVTLDGE